MELGEEKERVVYDFEVDMTDEEKRILLEYAMDNIPIDVMDNLLLNWAMIDILEKKINEITAEATTND